MKIAVYGAGAVGGLMAARLAATDGGTRADVSVIARGATLAALRSQGMRLQTADRLLAVPVPAEEDPAALGVQDVVIVAVKATALADVAARIAPLVGPDTLVVTAMNGVPWWFFDHPALPFAGTRLASLDPDGTLLKTIPTRQVIGCVVHLSSTSPEPGLVHPGFGNRLIVGEPAGGMSARLDRLAMLLRDAGFDVEASTDIRTDIWYKLWGNMTMNPLSAITGATCDRLLDDPLVRDFCLAAMREAADIGSKIGCPITQSGEDRMAVTRKLGAFKTSMLQDAEAGKALEIDALVTAVQEIGKMADVATPTIDSLLGLVRVFARMRGLYPA
ncbi:MAG TPA: 2-dehydropantoate 2-reductase [Noviherbaspirillum sp.]|jgi:2-dehydropantoate 2-reductase|uniref:2-dehydropantoate 2-reductase n=1 Tax=Noviherbaspirillum sp. TaxID=1926288 RepID=UPI002DDCC269|nr:2-dehydropantoate 2-reductase [Noviherbaspirillum sp.]HEV2611842.1 2-dehydropantoate 2-reductase [Noviherbaspirillum sp.]